MKIDISNILPVSVLDQIDTLYLVGGSVRDHILGRLSNDHDFVVPGDARPFAEAVAQKLGANVFTIGTGQKANHRIVSGHDIYDFTSLVGNSIEDDLRRRDFTINAMAYEPRSKRLIDPFGGREDLTSGSIRLVSKEAIVDDPVRMLRAFRFAAVLGFKIAAETLGGIKSERGRIGGVAGERIRSELFQIMELEDSFPTIHQMAELDLLTEIVPELDPARGCMQNDMHLRDVFDHTMDVYAEIENVLVDFKNIWPRFSDDIVSYLNDDDYRILLKWAALLHDLGKPCCRETDEHGRVMFRRHEKDSARLSAAVCSRLRMSNRHADFVNEIVAEHLKPLLLFNAGRQGTLTSRGIVRFIRKHKEHIIGLLIHSLADQRVKGGVDEKLVKEFVGFAYQVFHTYFIEMKPRMVLPKLVTGKDLIRHFNLQSSKLIGQVLDRLEEAQLNGEISTTQEAMAVAARLIHTLST